LYLFSPISFRSNAVCYTAFNLPEETLKLVKLAISFRKEEILKHFKTVFKQCQDELKPRVSPTPGSYTVNASMSEAFLTSSVNSLPSFSDLAASNTTGFNLSGDDSDFKFEGAGEPVFGSESKTEADIACPREKASQGAIDAAASEEVEIFKERAKGFRYESKALFTVAIMLQKISLVKWEKRLDIFLSSLAKYVKWLIK
jgi:hypothetical protein